MILVHSLGLVDYQTTLNAMRAFTQTRSAQTCDEIWLVQHPPVYTLGLAGKREHLLRATHIPVIDTERGGQITYHGPGQVIAYLLIDLRRRNLKVREFVSLLEAAVIAVLATYNIHGQRKAGAPGIYVQQDHRLDKIAALGLKIANGCSYHGVSLNVNMDLTPFLAINPCGDPELRTIDCNSLGIDADSAIVAEQLAAALIAQLENQETL